MTLAPITLLEATSAAELHERDELVRRFRKLRADAIQARRDYEHWNRINPDLRPIDTAWEAEVIAWCDHVLGTTEEG
jgi:hypothetical protein